MKSKNFILPFLFVLLLIFGCEGDYVYKHEHPDFLIGNWHGTLDDNLVNLSLNHDDSYEYTELKADSSLVYSENGYWIFMFLQREHIDEVDFTLDHDLIFSVSESSKPENIGVRTYLEFDYFEDETLEIYISDNETLTLQKR